MKVLITLMGPSNWGLFNSIWGMIRSHNFVPDRVYIMGREMDLGEFENIRKMVKPLLKEYGSRGEIRFGEIRGGMVDDIFEKVLTILEKEDLKGNELALDVTPGRKAAVLGSLFAGWKDGRMSRFDHIFYLYIESLRNASRPFILIPMSVQRCHDIPRENRGAQDEI